LPKPVPIQSAIPSEAVGDALCILEFLSCFKSVFEFDLPANLSFGTLFYKAAFFVGLLTAYDACELMNCTA